MKILLVSNYQPPHMGGIEFAAGALKRCWERDGHAVTWLTTDIPRGGQPSTAENVRIPACNVFERLWEINSPIVSPCGNPRIRKLIREHDIVNIHSLAPGLSSVCLSAAIRCRRPAVVTQHVAIIPLASKLLTAVQHHVICAAARRAVRQDIPLTFVGEAVRRWFIEESGIPAEMTHMTPAGIEPDKYFLVPDSERAALMRKWNLPENQFKVLFVGRFYEKKGLQLIREVAEQCPDILFSFRGSGPDDPALWNLPNVCILPMATDRELREIYGCHDLFIMPSIGEGWPAVIPQAMACGLGCMISEETFQGYNRDRDQFIVVPRNADAIVKQLNDAKEDRIPWLKNRVGISDYAVRTWNWQQTARIYSEIFEKQVQNAGRSGGRQADLHE